MASEPIPKDIFQNWHKAIEEYSTEFGTALEKRENKYKKALIYITEFTQLGTFKYHFKEIIGKDQVILKNPVKIKFKLFALMRGQ